MSERVQQSAVDLDKLRREAEESVSIEDAEWPEGWMPVVWSSRIVIALLDLAALGAAWARVEAALPEGWRLEGLERGAMNVQDFSGHDDWLSWWEARARGPFEGRQMSQGPTPTAALNALADALSAPVEER